MVVALGAGDGEAEPCGGGGVDAVEEDDVALFFGDGAAFSVEEVVAIEGGGDELVFGGIGEEIAGELFDGEAVEGHVAVEGADYPVAPDVLVGIAVLLEAVAVGVAGGVEPWEGHAFAVVWGGDDLVGEEIGGVGSGVIDEGVDFGWFWREPGEVGVEAADECGAVGFGGWGEASGVEGGEDEEVDGVAGPCGVADGWEGRADGRDEGPVGFVGGAGGDPAAEEGALGVGEGAVGVRGRHDFVRVRGDETFDEFAFVGVAGDEGVFGDGGVAGVEAEVGFTFIAVLAVAVEAVFAEDGADVAIEGDLCGWGGEREGSEEGAQEGAEHDGSSYGGGRGRLSGRAGGALRVCRWRETRGGRRL